MRVAVLATLHAGSRSHRRRAFSKLKALLRKAGTRTREALIEAMGWALDALTAYDQRPCAGALYRLDPHGSVHVVLENVTISNGLEWSPDSSHAYYNDTPTQRIDVFDYDGESG